MMNYKSQLQDRISGLITIESIDDQMNRLNDNSLVYINIHTGALKTKVYIIILTFTRGWYNRESLKFMVY